MTVPRYPAAITRLPMPALFEARGQAAALREGVIAAGLPWPDAFNRLASDPAGTSVVRLGPVRAMIMAPLSREVALAHALERSFASIIDADAVIVSDMYAGFTVTGAGAEDVLRQGAPLDLSRGAFPEGCATGTEVWGVTAIIHRQTPPEGAFLVLVEASFSGYIEGWLYTAAGLPTPLKPGVMTNPPPSIRPA